jgi:hypothetical protein
LTKIIRLSQEEQYTRTAKSFTTTTKISRTAIHIMGIDINHLNDECFDLITSDSSLTRTKYSNESDSSLCGNQFSSFDGRSQDAT